jgi:hypothetical protein
VRGGAVSDEELRTIGIGSGVGHGEDARLVVAAVGFALAFELIAGVSGAGAEGAAALDHEVGDNTVEAQPIVEPARGEVKEGADGDGCVIGKEGEVDVALVGLDGDFNVVHEGDNLTRILPVKSPLSALIGSLLRVGPRRG